MLPTSLTIRPAIASDVPLILSFIRELAEYERLSHEVVATEDLLRQSLFGPRPASEVALAFLAEEAVGFAVYFSSYSTFLAQPGLYLEDLFVRPHARGQGIGKALLAHIARLALERNYGRVEWSVLNWNEPAIQFYRSLGAQPRDEWTFYRITGEALARLAQSTSHASP